MSRDHTVSGHRYAIYDVFTETLLAGNPLAVVFCDGGEAPFSTEAMQAIAREFNLSETVFVLPPAQPPHTAQLRIFTPAAELPFAGHPTVGASVAIAAERQGSESSSVLMLEEKAGDIRSVVTLHETKGDRIAGFAEFDLPRSAVRLPHVPRRVEVAQALSLSEHQLGFENHVLSVWSAGVPYVCVPLNDLQTVAECRIDPRLWGRLAPVENGILADAFVYCRGGVDHRADFHARMFAPAMGIAEDPATGSAVAALSGAIREFDYLPDGHHSFMIEQGVEMGRPSCISLHMDIDGGKIGRTRIGGHAVRVAEGRLFAPSGG